MDALPDTERHAAAIRNAAWWVRHYRRPIATQRIKRAQAIALLGAIVREAFNASEEYEPLANRDRRRLAAVHHAAAVLARHLCDEPLKEAEHRHRHDRERRE